MDQYYLNRLKNLAVLDHIRTSGMGSYDALTKAILRYQYNNDCIMLTKVREGVKEGYYTMYSLQGEICARYRNILKDM